MAGLYDNYRMAQSQMVRPYSGSALSELQGLGSEMQKRYDMTTYNEDLMGQIANSLVPDAKDKGVYDSAISAARNNLSQLASREDKENLVRQSTIAARDFSNEAKLIMDNKARILARREEIDKNDKISANTKERVKNLEYAMYSGLKRDANGRITNQFTGSLTPADDIDAAALVNKIEEGIKANSGGRETRYIKGNYYFTDGASNEEVKADRVRDIARRIIDTDPKVQSYLKFQGQLSGLEAGLNFRSLDGMKDSALREQIRNTAMSQGVSEKDVVASMAAQKAQNTIYNNLVEAAVGKAAYLKWTRKNEINGETEEAGRNATDPTRFIISAPTMVGTGEFQGLGRGDIEKKIEGTNAAVVQQQQLIDRLIRTGAAPSDLEAARAKKRQLQDQQLAAQGILDNTKDQVARQLGYNNYEDFQNRGVQSVVDKEMSKYKVDGEGNITNAMPGGVMWHPDQKSIVKVYDVNGKLIPDNHDLPAAEVARAMKNNAVKLVRDPWGREDRDYYEIPLYAGRSVRMGVKDFNSTDIGKSFHQVQRESFGDFDNKVRDAFKNGKNLSYNTHQVSLTEKDGTKQLEEMYKSDPTAFAIYDRSGKPITDPDDFPADIKINSAQVVKGGAGSVMLQGYKENKDKNGRITSTDYYTISPVSGNNVGAVLGTKFMTEAAKMKDKQGAQDLIRIGVNLRGDRWDATFKDAAVNQPIPLDTDQGTVGYIKKVPVEGNEGKIVYRLYRKDGVTQSKVMGKNGMLQDIIANNEMEAAELARGIIERANQDNANKANQ